MTEETVDGRVEELALDKTFLWRLEKFRDLGFNPRQRAKLAAAAVDWHEANRLLADGCPVDVAFDILS